MKRFLILILALTFAGGALAQQAHEASGSVVRVNPAKGQAMIQHGPVASLNWPGMTMGFDVKDKALFDKLKPGAKIQFTFVESGRSYVITKVK